MCWSMSIWSSRSLHIGLGVPGVDAHDDFGLLVDAFLVEATVIVEDLDHLHALSNLGLVVLGHGGKLFNPLIAFLSFAATVFPSFQ